MINRIRDETSSYACPLLSFSLNAHSTSSKSLHARSGTLKLSSRGADHDTTLQTIETPAIISHSTRGAVKHLTTDNLSKCHFDAIHVALEHFLDFQPPPYSNAPFSLHHYLGLSTEQLRLHSQRQQGRDGDSAAAVDGGKEDRVLVSMSLRDPSRNGEKAFQGRTKSVPTNGDEEAIAVGGRGVVKVSPEKFLDWTLPRPPDVLFALADEPNEVEPSKKRLEKSVKRSLVWTERVARGTNQQANVFATLVGNHDSARRTEFSKALVGIASSRATAFASTTSPIDDLVAGYVIPCSPAPSPELLHASLDPLPPKKPRVAMCPRGPHEILRMVRDGGIDLVVEEWSQTCSTYGIALDFEFPVAPPSSSESSATSMDVGKNLYLKEHAFSFTTLSESSLALDPLEDHPFGPAPPTRSYVHHLLLAHEITAHVILSLHNLTIMRKLFKSIRTMLQSEGGVERFEREVERFEQRYSDRSSEGGGDEYEVVLDGKKAWEIVDKARGKGSLKDKTLSVDDHEAAEIELDKVDNRNAHFVGDVETR